MVTPLVGLFTVPVADPDESPAPVTAHVIFVTAQLSLKVGAASPSLAVTIRFRSPDVATDKVKSLWQLMEGL